MTPTGRRRSSLAGVILLVGGLAASMPEVPTSASEPLWLAPSAVPTRPSALATALQHLADDKAAASLPALKLGAGDATVGAYVRVHQGRAELSLNRTADAMASARAALAAARTPYLTERALWLLADAAEAGAQWSTAADALEKLVQLPSTTPAQAAYRLGVALRQLNRTDDAVSAFSRVYFDFPTTDEAAQAAGDLAALSSSFRVVTADRAPRELQRAHVLFAARRHPEARTAYDGVRPHVAGDDLDLVTLRLAQLDAHQKRLPAALSALRAYLGRETVPAGRRDEAGYAVLGVLRDMGRHAEYETEVWSFVAGATDAALAEAALNDLGTHHIVTDADDKAAQVFTEQYARFPQGPFAGRAAWKAGWWAFTNANYGETIRLFESAAAGLRRSDYRSAWVYWAARAHERLGHHDQAIEGYDATIRDYGASYYGREAARARETLLAARRPAGAGPVTPIRREPARVLEPGAPPATASLIQSLLSAQLWDDAIGEIRRAQRDEGPTPLLDATLAYALNRNGDLRPAITAMKRAYPQYLADGIDVLPRELLTVIFPLDYWDLIQKHARQHDLDPYLIAALMAQESTFDEKIRSAANAWGLMQILPSTGARVARQLKIRPFSTASLTKPEVNVRIGTQYFADLVRRFNGDVAAALAAYNAGENRVDRWLAERPGLDRDEFVDNIPFPETQGYVKKILGTAEDYRLLYRQTGTGR